MAKKKHSTSTVYRQELQDALDAVIRHGSAAEASRQTSIPTTTLKDRRDKAIELGLHPSKGALKDAGLKPPKGAVPFSEDESKFKADWTPEDCIEELMRLVKANPDQIISRNFFRVYSCISESTWNRYFGTFEEFKRQAGVKLSRHQHRMELDVAKHASLDRFRQMTMEKQDWGDAYRKPSATRFKSVLVASDIHDHECDPFWRRVFLDTARRMQPDLVVINGDIFDLPEFGKYHTDPREWGAVERIEWVHGFFSELRQACPNTEIDLIEGNHENRLLRHLAESSPAMQAVLADLHGWSVPDLLGLTTFEVNYVAPADLGTLTRADQRAEIRKNWKVYYDAFLCCHFPEARSWGYPGFSGHHHAYKVWDLYGPRFGSYKWVQLGAGHKREASFTNGAKWDNGFAVVHVDTHTQASVFEYVDIKDFACVGGTYYVRDEKE